MGKWKSESSIPTFPQPLQPAAQGRKAFGEEGDIQEEKSGHRDPTTHSLSGSHCIGTGTRFQDHPSIGKCGRAIVPRSDFEPLWRRIPASAVSRGGTPSELLEASDALHGGASDALGSNFERLISRRLVFPRSRGDRQQDMRHLPRVVMKKRVRPQRRSSFARPANPGLLYDGSGVA